MKRSQVDEENCGHWEFEVQHPGDMASDRSPTPRNFGMTTRRLRFLRSSRDLTSGMTLVEAASAVDETTSPVQRARTDFSSALATIEQGVNRRTSVGADEKLSGSLDRDGGVMSADHGVLETTEISMVVVHEDEVPGSSQRVADELRQEIDPSPQEGTPSTGAGKPLRDHGDDDRGKENRDPLHRPIAVHRSPLPEWFPRRPLQDITNILNGGLVRYLVRFTFIVADNRVQYDFLHTFPP